MPTSIICIPRAELSSHETEINELANRLYNSDRVVRFLEEYVPMGGRVPGTGPQRVSMFRNFLLHQPQCLVIVYVDGECCGFIMFLNVPFSQSVGFGIHPDYARTGVMSTAWKMIIEQCKCFKFPLYGYTSCKNPGSNSFLRANGFELVQDDIDFLGERSNKYVHYGSKPNDSDHLVPIKEKEILPEPTPPPKPVKPTKPKSLIDLDRYKAAEGKPADEYDVVGRFISESLNRGESVKKMMESREYLPEPSKAFVDFDLTDEELSASVYYGAAGIDIQPLLRFGDMARDFIYVNAGLKCNDFLNGVEHALMRLNVQHPGMLRCIERAQISQLPGPLLLQYPAFMNPGQIQRYKDAFGPYLNDAGTCRWLLKFELQVGTKIRELRLWHFNGEAIATYDRMFIRRNLAPKIFISIQSGAMEKPDYMTNAMFASCAVRPKAWVRGVWSNQNHWLLPKEVFDANGIYDQKIWETRGWDADFGYHIEGTTNPTEYPYRLVAGYGEKNVWDVLAPLGDVSVLAGINVTIHKRNIPHNTALHTGYTREIDPVIHSLLTIPANLTCRRRYLADQVKECEYDIVAHVSPPIYSTYRWAWAHFESHEMYYDEFVATFVPLNGVHLMLDVFYKWPLEYKRNF